MNKNRLLYQKLKNNEFFRIMKISLLLLFCCVFNLMAVDSDAQNATIKLSSKNMSMARFFDEIEKQTDYLVVYSNSEVNTSQSVTFDKTSGSVADYLQEAFSNSELSYEFENDYIVLSKRAILQSVKQTGRPISGKVLDRNGESLIGASVVEKGTTNGVSTDADGNFSLTVGEKAVLQISYLGYVTQEVTVGDQTQINITLYEDSHQIDEVVVVGYGTQKKSDLTGSVSSVKMSEISQTPVTSIDQGLAGRASGVQVIQTSGMPGAVASIRVRGSSSLQGGNEPLYVIDGFPVYAGTGVSSTASIQSAMGKASLSGLATINPADIESIEILKDASATAIYGARAANGVVLITTKSGQKGRDIVSFDASFGVSSVVKKIDLLKAQDYAALVNDAYIWGDGATSTNGQPYYDAAQMAEIAKLETVRIGRMKFSDRVLLKIIN